MPIVKKRLCPAPRCGAFAGAGALLKVAPHQVRGRDSISNLLYSPTAFFSSALAWASQSSGCASRSALNTSRSSGSVATTFSAQGDVLGFQRFTGPVASHVSGSSVMARRMAASSSSVTGMIFGSVRSAISCLSCPFTFFGSGGPAKRDYSGRFFSFGNGDRIKFIANGADHQITLLPVNIVNVVDGILPRKPVHRFETDAVFSAVDRVFGFIPLVFHRIFLAEKPFSRNLSPRGSA